MESCPTAEIHESRARLHVDVASIYDLKGLCVEFGNRNLVKNGYVGTIPVQIPERLLN